MKRTWVTACLLLAIMMVITGCGGNSGDESTQSPEISATPLPSPKMETITVFTIDQSSMTLVPSQVKKNEDDDSVLYIASLVEDNLEDGGIHVSDAFLEDNKAIVVFDSEHKPMTGCSEDMELLILDCFASSILDNVDKCNAVIFRSDKGRYESDHLTLEEDEVYASE